MNSLNIDVITGRNDDEKDTCRLSVDGDDTLATFAIGASIQLIVDDNKNGNSFQIWLMKKESLALAKRILLLIGWQTSFDVSSFMSSIKPEYLNALGDDDLFLLQDEIEKELNKRKRK